MGRGDYGHAVHSARAASAPVLPTVLTDALATAGRFGSAVFDAALEDVAAAVRAVGGSVVRSRGGAGPDIEVLRAKSALEAHPQSLSALHGLGAFPLHIDGAHLRRPPQWLVLEGPGRVGTGGTLVLGSAAWDNGDDCLRRGMFKVGFGRAAFYAPAVDDGGLRFDAGCMAPADGAARRAADHFARLRDLARTHEWDAGPTLLLVDNRQALHGRQEVRDYRRLRRLMFSLDTA